MREKISIFVFPLIVLLSASSPLEVQDKSIDQVIAGGVNFLLGSQESDGSWTKKYIISQQFAGGRGAFTSIALLGLRGHKNTDSKINDAISKARQYLLDAVKLASKINEGNDNSFWNRAYSLLALVSLYREKADDGLKGVIQGNIDELVAGQRKSEKEERGGGWYYHIFRGKDGEEEDEAKKKLTDQFKDKKNPQKSDCSGTELFGRGLPVTFLTSVCLIALLEAKDAGFAVPQEAIQAGVSYLNRMRQQDGSFKYYGKTTFTNKLAGSCVRSAPCELALLLAGHGSKERLASAVSIFFKHRDIVDKAWEKQKSEGKKLIMHSATKEGVAPYFFFYGYFWTLQALYFIDKDTPIQIDKADEKSTKSPAECIEILKKTMVKTQTSDGSWYDGPLGGAHYGTGSALVVISGQKLVQSNPTERK